MYEVKKIKANGLFPLVSDLLDQGQSVRLPVSGNSMYPFLRDGIDSVEFSRGSFADIKRGDIVLIRRTAGAYVMHRVIRKKADCFFMVGDAQQWIEGPLYPDQLISVVTAIWREDKRISCSDIRLKLLAGIWLILRPKRYFIMKVYRKICKIIR